MGPTVIRRYYNYFERAVALLLTGGVIIVVIIASFHLAKSLWDVFTTTGFETFEYVQFQGIFEQILTVLIALEFNHSLMQVVAGTHGLIQVRTIVLIAILAVVRKFIVIDIDEVKGPLLVGLAVSIFAIGAVYLMLAMIDTRNGESVQLPGRGRRKPDDDHDKPPSVPPGEELERV